MQASLPSDVPRTPTTSKATSPLPYVLTFPEPRVALFEKKPGAWRWLGLRFLRVEALVLFGLVGIAILAIRAGGPGSALVLYGILMLGTGGALAALEIHSFVVYVRGGMRFDRYREKLVMRRPRGSIGPEVPLEDVAAVQLLVVGRRGVEMNLVFAQPRGERLRVMFHRNGTELLRDAERLAEFLEVPLLDHTIDTISVDGRQVRVDRLVLPGSGPVYATMELRPEGDGRMILEQTKQGRKIGRAFAVALSILGTLLIVGGLVVIIGHFVAPETQRASPIEFVSAAFCAGLGAFILVTMRRDLWTPPVIFDRVAGVVRGKKLTVDKVNVGQTEIPLGDVAVVQVCARESDGHGGAPGHTVYQLNLLLKPRARASD